MSASLDIAFISTMSCWSITKSGMYADFINSPLYVIDSSGMTRERNARESQLTGKAPIIRGFQQPWAKGSMHLNRAPDYFSSQVSIPSHPRRSAAERGTKIFRCILCSPSDVGFRFLPMVMPPRLLTIPALLHITPPPAPVLARIQEQPVAILRTAFLHACRVFR